MLDKERVRAVLPGDADVPPGWKAATAYRMDSPGPDGSLAFGRRAYSAPDLNGDVGFGLSSFRSRSQAGAGYDKTKRLYAGVREGTARVEGADAAFTAVYCLGRSYCSSSIQMRVGLVTAYVNLNTDRPPAADPKVLNSMARSFVLRIRQAEQGQRPAAKAG
ncbi:hypothetical protein ABT072_45830 [Streptomyces sp. NPDC002589]|uniref:hypothetical protein n=1 Tax=Streptomyces sp. NPDC002589 TaxID=3154420 RepID=UPI003323D665